jgi:chromosome segregation ATPase
MDMVNKTLREAVEKAGARADKMEEAALVKLRDQAQDRVNRFQAVWEEKLKSSQEAVKTRLAGIQEQIKTFRDEWKKEQGEFEARQRQNQEAWKAEQGELETRQERYREEWETKVRELDALIGRQRDEWNAAFSGQRESWNREVRDLDARIDRQREEWGAALGQQREALANSALGQQDEIHAALVRQRDEWASIVRDAERQILESSGARIEEYKQAQVEEFKQLASLADDAARLGEELRLSMRETVNRVNADFGRFEQEAARSREVSAEEFETQVRVLKAEMDGVERELNALKSQAYENVSEKLKLFEDDFFSDLNKRSVEIDSRITEWHDNLEGRLEEMAETGMEERRQSELRLGEELRRSLAGQGERLRAELERLKAEAGAFEEGIREEMRGADETRRSFQEQLDRDLEEVRRRAEDSAKNEIGRYSLTVAENLKQNQRELEERLREIAGQAESRRDEISGFLDESRRSMEEWQNSYTGQVREMDASMDEARRRIRDLVAESDDRLASVHGSIEDIRKELVDQTKLFDKAGELKLELERRMEDLSGDLDRLDQRKNEVAQLENQFIRIKRLEDDVNAKMTRFLSEKHRIEVMEADFNRLLRTSQAVEEKLVQVSSSDDVLQAMQVQIRRLDDAVREAEEKYQRVERKNQILEETNSGIDRNFKVLQESEETARRAGEELARIGREIESFHASIEGLAAENTKALDTMDKLSTLDDSLALIEKRIDEMQVARDWLARTETRLAELDKQAQTELRLIGSLLNRDGKSPPAGKGAPPPRDRDNIIKLRRQGWTVDEIAASLEISKGEVELILEIGMKN